MLSSMLIGLHATCALSLHTFQPTLHTMHPTLRMLPMLPRPALWASVALVAAALFCKYGLQGRPGTPAYWWPHALWHLLIAAGQTLLAVALPRV